MPQRRASSSTVGGVVLAATAFSSTMARSTAWMRCTPSAAVPGTSALLATGRDIRCSIATIGSAAGLAPAALAGKGPAVSTCERNTREALAAAGVEEVFRAGTVLCHAGADAMIIDSGWVKVSIPEDPGTAEEILAVRGQRDVVGERTARTTSVRSAMATALDEVSATVDTARLTSGMLEVLRELGAPESVTVPARGGARTASAGPGNS